MVVNLKKWLSTILESIIGEYKHIEKKVSDISTIADPKFREILEDKHSISSTMADALMPEIDNFTPFLDIGKHTNLAKILERIEVLAQNSEMSAYSWSPSNSNDDIPNDAAVCRLVKPNANKMFKNDFFFSFLDNFPPIL